MSNQIKIFVYGSCHFSGKNENDDAVGNGSYAFVITENVNTFVTKTINAKSPSS